VTLSHVESPVPQRRSYARVETGRSVIVYRGRDAEQLQSSTVDLSGGGLLLDGADTLSIGEEVEFRLTLAPDAQPVTGTARVVRITPEGRRGLAFESISDLDRRRLVRFIFERERDERRRGIGQGR
jgi:c-di-GMP-binding flagellar brake protein YcgR